VIVESSTTVVAKAELVDTCKRYVVAPGETFQYKVSVVGRSVAPSIGKTRFGGAGGGILISNVQDA
jgi:hypothetical protein